MTIVNLEGDWAKVGIATPFKISWNDQRMAHWLHVTIEDDNLMSSAKFHWVLFSDTMESLQSGDVVCSGEDYASWDGSNEFPFIYVSNELEIEIA